MKQFLKLSSKCEDHFFNSSLNRTSQTFLSIIIQKWIIDLSVKRLIWLDLKKTIQFTTAGKTNEHCALEHEDNAKTPLLFEPKVITHLILRWPSIAVREKPAWWNKIIKVMLPAFDLSTFLVNFSDGIHRYVHRIVI